MLQCKTRLISGLFFLIIALPCLAQQTREDSLLVLYHNAKNDSVKAEIGLQLGELLSTENRNKSNKYYQDALQFATDKSNIGLIHYKIGFNNWQLGNFENAISRFNRAAEYFEELQDSSWLGKTYNNIAATNWGMGNINEALNFYHIALNIRRAIDDKIGVAKVLNNIGLIYQEWRLYEEAFEWHNEALEVALKTGDNNVIAYSYSNIGNCFLNTNEPDTALRSYKVGYRYLLENGPQNRSSSFFLVNIGEVFSKMNRPDSAFYYLQEARKEATRINNQHRIAIANYYLGETYLNINMPDSARPYIEKSYVLSVEKNYTDLISDNLFALSEISEKKGNLSEALEFYKKASALKDSLFNAEKVSKFTELQIEHFTQQQKQENQLLKQENEIQKIAIQKQKLLSLGLITVGLLILIILIFIARSRISFKRLSSRLEKSESELKRINDDKDKFFTIIAHDLKSPFNGLLGVTEMLTSEYDNLSTAEVKNMLRMLKQSAANVYALLEGLLQWAQIQTGKMTYAFEKIDIYEVTFKVTELLSAIADNKNIQIDHRVEKGTFAKADEKSTAAILRNLISNAIKFTNPGGKIIVKAIEKNREIQISVIDNGIGMDKKMLDKLFMISVKESREGTAEEKGTGLGLILCKEFAEKNNGRIWAESEVGKGTTITFTLPAG
jgi:signal transduction histidine kinase